MALLFCEIDPFNQKMHVIIHDSPFFSAQSPCKAICVMLRDCAAYEAQKPSIPVTSIMPG
jgi:hypothetical protein